MRKKILFLLFILFIPIFFSGCFAIVEEDTSTKRVKSFIIPKEEVLDTLQRIEEQHPRYEYEFYIEDGQESKLIFKKYCFKKKVSLDIQKGGEYGYRS